MEYVANPIPSSRETPVSMRCRRTRRKQLAHGKALNNANSAMVGKHLSAM
jgi:hypothetical protein